MQTEETSANGEARNARMHGPALLLDFAAWRTRLLSGIREEERRFLETLGEHREETARVGRMMRDIMRGFHELRGVERAVTVFGSARFTRRSAYYRTTMLSFAEITDSPEALRFIEAMLATHGTSARTGAGLPHDDT